MMKCPLWWVSESSHVEIHVTRGWHPNREYAGGDLRCFLVFGQVGDICQSVCDEFHLVRNEFTTRQSPPHTRGFRLFSKMILSTVLKIFRKKGEDWPNSCEADSPSELSYVTHWTYPATCFWQNCFQAQHGWVMILKIGDNCSDVTSVDCHSIVEMNYTRW